MICTARFGASPGCNKAPDVPLGCDEGGDHQSDWCECSRP
jgi:hypothetical protein